MQQCNTGSLKRRVHGSHAWHTSTKCCTATNPWQLPTVQGHRLIQCAWGPGLGEHRMQQSSTGSLACRTSTPRTGLSSIGDHGGRAQWYQEL